MAYPPEITPCSSNREKDTLFPPGFNALKPEFNLDPLLQISQHPRLQWQNKVCF